jgi:hypothetical protein
MGTVFHPLPKDVAITEDMISINIMNYFHYTHTTANVFTKQCLHKHIPKAKKKYIQI